MIQDLRLALRSLAKSPGFTTVAVLMLALGVGASTACFSFLNAFFLRPPPFERPDELVSLHSTEDKTPGLMRLSVPNFTDYRANNTVFTDLALHLFLGVRFTEGENNSILFGHLVSGSYFDLLGVKPVLGRPLSVADDVEGAPPVVVVSHAFWQTRLAASPEALGRTLLFNNVPFTVVGVAPAGFRGISVIDAPDYWMPTSVYRSVLLGQGLEFFISRRAVTVSVIGRLKPGVTLGQAAASLKPLSEKLAIDFPADNAGRSLRLVPIAQAMLDPNRRSDLLRAGNLLIALAGLILLIACANLANLLLARAGARQREIALRVALGASRGQVVGQLLRENFLLAALGGGLGVVISVWLRDLLWALRPPGFPDNMEVNVDGRVLAFAVSATILTGLLFGVVPALAASRVDLIAILKRVPSGDNGLSIFSFRHVLVAAQVALSVVALVIAGLFVRSLNQASAVTLGWNSRNLALMSADLVQSGYNQTRTLEYYQRALARLRTVPGVLDVSIASRPFLTGVNPQRTIKPQGEDEALRTRGRFMSFAVVQPDFLRFMGLELVAGRDFSVDDNGTHPPAVIINEAMARLAWPGQDPIGKTIKLYNDETPVQVVGVTRNIRDVELRADPAPFAFFPVAQFFEAANVFHIRTAGNPTDLLPTLRKELQSLDPAVNLRSIDYREVIRNALWGSRTGATLMSVFGVIALFLTLLGIYAVMAQAVVQRTREIGICLALGAQTRAVVGLILKRGVIVTGVGVLGGLAAACGLTRYVGSFLFEVKPTDPLTFAVIAGLLSGVALLACYIPARRATKVDPLIALRSE
ncbi:MAG: ABC transporter permease [Opitutae bacterium]|nr:ABC transporter permease [Opitutae bacterium]